MEAKRKGARSTKDIPANVMAQLNNGEIETANLVEWLAVNQPLLLENILKVHKRTKYLQPILAKINGLPKQTITTINEAIGVGLLEQSVQHKDAVFLEILMTHPSDSVRCWATYTIGRNEKLSLEKKIKQMQTLGADAHFGVREIAWMAVRPSIAENLTASLHILSKWTNHANENVRRFASEATRPRGVWCAHIEMLKTNPELGLCILEPLKNDPAKYVQDSVANWLNDASKTQAKFVIDICKKWSAESKTKETAYIVKRALRTLEKAK